MTQAFEPNLFVVGAAVNLVIVAVILVTIVTRPIDDVQSAGARQFGRRAAFVERQECGPDVFAEIAPCEVRAIAGCLDDTRQVSPVELDVVPPAVAANLGRDPAFVRTVELNASLTMVLGASLSDTAVEIVRTSVG